MILLGCVSQEKQYDFPINDELPRPGFGDIVYSVCEDVLTEMRVYSVSSCGIDSCNIELYGLDGQLIEQGNIGMVPNPHEFKTNVTGCKRTTEEYFRTKVNVV